MFKVGDNVWTIQSGWAKIVEIDPDAIYSIKTSSDTYFEDGRMYKSDIHPSLFSYDPLNGTEPPIEFVGSVELRIASFYKMRFIANGMWFVAEWRGNVFEMGGYRYELDEVSDVVLMKEA